MAPYATAQNIIDRYGEEFVVLSFDKDHDGIADDGVIDSALVDATSLMNSYIGSRYTLPLAVVPDILLKHCVDIATYFGSGEAGTLTDEKRKRYEDAIAWLEALSEGTTSVGTIDPPQSFDNSAYVVSPNPRNFTRATMKGLW